MTFYRIDCPTARPAPTRPTRFPSGIYVDPSNPYHAFVTYSGYNAYADCRRHGHGPHLRGVGQPG